MKENFNNILVHVPHSSLAIPEEYLGDFDQTKLNHELLVMTDWYCDELFDFGAELLAFPVSRLVCDVERFRDDKDEVMSRVGMGLYYTAASDLSPLRTMDIKKRQEILDRYYDSHHDRLTALVEAKLQSYGSCLLIDGHSFYSEPLPYELDQDSDRPDICLGTDGFHTPESLAREWQDYLQQMGLRVKINSPFAGTMVPMRFYHKEPRVQSIMVEVNRKLYMDAYGNRTVGYIELKNILTEMFKMSPGR